MNILDFIGLFLFIAGFVVGLGAVTVIDTLGFLGRKSSYWTEATVRSHKVTKPLIWLGIILATIGGAITYREMGTEFPVVYHGIALAVLVLNGIFLSFGVSPFLLKRERDGMSRELLPEKWQFWITISFVISFTFWWGSLILLVLFLMS